MIRRLRPALAGFRLPRLRDERPDAALPVRPGRRTVRLYLVKPSRYEDDGTVLRFRWGVIPNNTLTVLAGIVAADARAREGVDVQTVLWDELVDGVLSEEEIASICDQAERDGAELLIGLAGVQTNQYPRARDIGLQFRRRGVPALMGGFHVSSDPPTRDFLASVGISSVVGEAESTWPAILEDHLGGRLQACYRVSEGLRARTGLGEILVPTIEGSALPAISPRYLSRFFNPTFSTLDTSRGCPFVCSYCSVKNVMGRRMRVRSPERVLEWVREAHDAFGVRTLLLVDDDFFRNPAWEEVLDGMARLRREGHAPSFVMQTDLEASLDERAGASGGRRFAELAAAAGCYEVFLGLESFDPRNLEHAQKLQNEDREDRRRRGGDLDDVARRVKARYRRAVEAWHRAGVSVHVGYIIGLPFDDVGCGRRAARELAEIGVDLASFFASTPFPGTEDHVAAVAAGRITSHDFNDYDSTRFVTTHPRLEARQLAREYREAYRSFYSWRRLGWSLATVHRVPGLSLATRLAMLSQQGYFTYAQRRGHHPMMGGIWRLHDRSVRRRAVSDEEAVRSYLGGRSGSGVGRCPEPAAVG